jgi:hypothetical protein
LAGTFGLIGLTVAAGLAVVWWFRRADRRVRARLGQVRPGRTVAGGEWAEAVGGPAED